MSDDRLADRWARRDAPILLELARAAEDGDRLLVDDVTNTLALRYRDVIDSVDTLKRTRYLDSVHFSHDSGGEYTSIRLTEKGLREVGLWPTPGTALDRMIEALEAIAANTDDEDARTRARKVLDGLSGAGRQIGISVATAMVTGQMPGQ